MSSASAMDDSETNDRNDGQMAGISRASPLVPMAISVRGTCTTWLCALSIAIDRCYVHTLRKPLQYVLCLRSHRQNYYMNACDFKPFCT